MGPDRPDCQFAIKELFRYMQSPSVSNRNAMLRLGKYRGLEFEEAAEHDRSYAAWVLRERALPKTLGDYKAYRHETRGGILNIGKHRGKWFKEVVEQDPRHGGRALKP